MISSESCDSIHCTTCNQFLPTSQIGVHLNKCKGTFSCQLCTSTFTHKEYLQKHIRRKHSIKSAQKFDCDQCGRSCATKNSLLVHKRIHLKIFPYQCKVCEMKFVQLNNFQLHIDIKHSNCELDDAEKSYRCNVCKKGFFYISGLKYHMKEHYRVPCSEDAKKFACNQCEKRFQFNSELERHSFSHTAKEHYEHVCNICSKRFNQFRLLLAHNLDHEDSELFKCPRCNRKFSTKSYLQKHLLVHRQKCPKNDSLSKCSQEEEDILDYLGDIDLSKSFKNTDLLSDVKFNEQLLMTHLEKEKCIINGTLERDETSSAISTILNKEPLEMSDTDHMLVADIFREINNNE